MYICLQIDINTYYHSHLCVYTYVFICTYSYTCLFMHTCTYEFIILYNMYPFFEMISDSFGIHYKINFRT